MIQADGAALAAKLLARGERIVEGFPGDEAAREAIFHSAARNHRRHALFSGQPEDEVPDQHAVSAWEQAA
jgi:hypothetical protein